MGGGLHISLGLSMESSALQTNPTKRAHRHVHTKERRLEARDHKWGSGCRSGGGPGGRERKEWRGMCAHTVAYPTVKALGAALSGMCRGALAQFA
jgi:hypothetical protein